MSDDWQVVEEGLGGDFSFAGIGASEDTHRAALAALARLREREAYLKNGCEQALLLLERERFADDPEARVVRSVLRSALAHEEKK